MRSKKNPPNHYTTTVFFFIAYTITQMEKAIFGRFAKDLSNTINHATTVKAENNQKKKMMEVSTPQYNALQTGWETCNLNPHDL
jgi:hypothetical protein